MAFKDIPKTTAVRDSLSILLDNDRSAHELAGAAIPSAEKSVANGVATLDQDGRLVATQAPIGLAETLPTSAHDLNSYQTPGSYRQASTAGAQAGANYPQATGGLLEVEGTGVSGQTIQRYTVASTGSVTPTSGPRCYWRFGINTTWSPWHEFSTAGTALAYLGRIPASANLNDYAHRGMWAVAASSTASGGTNFPVANSGWLLVYTESFPGGAAGVNVNQVYIASNTNRMFFRSLVGSNWSAWDEVLKLSQLGAAMVATPLGVSDNLNDFDVPGTYSMNGNATALLELNYPVLLAGLLTVETSAGSNMQVTQTYVTNPASNPRTFRRIRFNANKYWGPWVELARVDQAMTHTFLTAATDANSLTADNTFYSWTSSAALGANFPSFSSNWAAAGYMRVVYGASTQVSQEVTFLITGQKPRTFFRFGNSANGTWQPWKATSAWHAPTGLPTTDMGDIYVDGVGWHKWDAATGAYQSVGTPLDQKGGVVSGNLGVGGALTVAGATTLTSGSLLIANASGAFMRLTHSGVMENTLRVSSTGFDVINQGYSSVNMSVRNSNGDGIFRGSVYASNGAAALSGDGNVNGTLWGGWLSTWLSSQLNARPMRDGTSFVGFANNDIRSPYMRHDPTGAIVTFIRNLSGVYSVRRLDGYLEYDTDAGVVGTNYFVSDARTKHDIKPATARATDLVSKLDFYSFRFKEGAEGKGNDPTKVHQIGVLAQDIQKMDPAYVDELSDGTLQPNAWNLLTLTLKGLQEANERIASLEKRLGL